MSTNALPVQGALVDIPMEFIDESNGNPIDPTVVEFNFICGSFGPEKFTYTNLSAPTTNAIWKISTGIYRARVDTTPFYGTFSGAAISKGTGQAAQLITFTVVQNPLLP